jgi:hypothetical protein
MIDAAAPPAKLLEDLRSEIAGLANDNTSAGRMFGRIRAEALLRAIGDRLVATLDAKGSIGEAWASYLAAVIPAGAGETQREESKRAFYAGAAAMFGDMLDAAELEEDAAAARLEALDRELADYLRLFKKREGIEP